GPAMLDAAFIRAHLDDVKRNCANRNVTADVDRVVALDDERKRLAGERQDLQHRAKEVQQRTSKEKDPTAQQQLIEAGRALRGQIGEVEQREKQVEADLVAVLLTLPNMTHPDAPVGTTAEANVVLRRWGEPRKFDFKPKDHVALCEALDLC